jgi:tryptophan 7-halogenase
MIDNNFKFVVVGGGTAGWLTALYIQKHFPNSNITVIASSEIGILGAGEGTTPHFLLFLDQLGISASDLVKHANATFKNGVKFTNWTGDNSHFYHPFADLGDLDHSFFSILNAGIPLLDLEEIALGNNLDSIDFTARASENMCVRYFPDNNSWNKNSNPLLHFTSLGNHALHFDANLLAKYLQDIGISRGIKLIDSTVDSLVNDSSGKIKDLVLSSGKIINANFVFDCSGFNRLIIGKHYNSTWNSYKDILPVNRAIPFFLPNSTKIIPPYTESIAMKHGWMWKIPVGERYGCGYVFNSNTITDKEAKEEIYNLVGNVDTPRAFSFEAGCFKEQWIKNCVSVGLSSSFVEPLEATSIWVSILSLTYLLENMPGIVTGDQHYIDRYNLYMEKINQQVLDFVSFHYITPRRDTTFWKDYTQNYKKTEVVEQLTTASKYTIPQTDFYKTNMFLFKSFYHIGAGTQFFNKEVAAKLYNSSVQGIRREQYADLKSKYLKNVNLALNNTVNHYDFLEYLKNN